MHNLVFGLDDACWHNLYLFLFLAFVIDLAVVESVLSLYESPLIFFLLLLFAHGIRLNFLDFLLQLRFRFVNIHVIQERIRSVYFYGHQSWLTTLALKVLHDFVIC